MTFHTQHFDDYDQAGYWLEHRTNLTNAQLEDLDEDFSGEIRFKATYPGGYMTLDYIKGEEFDIDAIQEFEYAPDSIMGIAGRMKALANEVRK
jgi:hypothetical protein